MLGNEEKVGKVWGKLVDDLTVALLDELEILGHQGLWINDSWKFLLVVNYQEMLPHMSEVFV